MADSAAGKPFSRFIGQPKPDDEPLGEDPRPYNAFNELDNPVGPSGTNAKFFHKPPKPWVPPNQKEEEE